MIDLANQEKKSIIWTIVAPIVVVLLLFLWFQAVFQSFVIEGISMTPNLQSGQVILVNKAAYWFGSPQRGDIVVFHSRTLQRAVIHRIVAMPNETVEVKGGKVYINGSPTPLDEPYAHGDSASYGPEKVAAGEYFILGDNRNNTAMEMVAAGDIIGKAWLSIWPLGKFGLAPNYSLEVE